MKFTEQKIQIEVAHYFRKLEERKGGFTFFHPANGGKRNIREAAKFKAMGVKAGVHDLVFLLPFGGCVLIELKARKGSLAKSQKIFHGIVKKLGHASFVVTADTGKEAIGTILKILEVHGGVNEK